MKVLIGGDIYLGGSLEKASAENPESLFRELAALCSQVDISLVNLECPITNSVEPIRKTGPNIKAAEASFAAIRYLNPTTVTLANNHILDFGITGLQDTLTICEKSNIDTVGAGMTLGQASKPYLKTVGDKTVAVVNFAENEWSSAEESHGGANPMNVVENVRQIHRARSVSDYVVVIVHGGHEHYAYPSPRMVNQYRFYAEQGASAVVGHHAHCVSGYEVYKEVPICYNIGNLLFDSTTKDANWFEGMLVELELNDTVKFRLIPYNQSKAGRPGVRFMKGDEEEAFFKKIERLSKSIHNGELEKKWSEFVRQEYLVRRRQVLSKTSKFYRLLAKLKLIEPFLNKRQSRLILNLMRCEAHRDVSIAVMEMAEKK